VEDIKKQKDIYPLCGVLTCSICGYSFSSYNRNRKRFYRCVGYSKYPDKNICNPSSVIDAEEIEKVIMERIIKNLSDGTGSRSFLYINVFRREELKALEEDLIELKKDRNELLTEELTLDNIDILEEKLFQVYKNIKFKREEIEAMEDNIMNFQRLDFSFQKQSLINRFSGKSYYYFKDMFEWLPQIEIKNLYKNLIKVEFNAINRSGVLTILTIPQSSMPPEHFSL